MSRILSTLVTLVGTGAALASAACGKRTPATTPTPGMAGQPAGDSVQIGYGAQARDKTTGATTTLSTADMTRRTVRLEELLRGRAAGVEIVQNGNDVRLRIRGSSSISQNVEPLVLVDGMAVSAGNISHALAGLIPEDIKQVNVLKDVASTSVYGGRGAGGVILITTNRKTPRE